MNTRSITKLALIVIGVSLSALAILLFSFYPKATAVSDTADETSAAPTATEPAVTPTPKPTPTPVPAAEPTPEPAPAEEASYDDEGEHAGVPEPVVTPAPEPKSQGPVIPENTVVDTSSQLYTYGAMAEDLAQLSAMYPDYLSVSVLNTTADGRNIYLARLGNPKAGKEILVHASMHAREYMTAMLAMSQLEFYLRNWDSAYAEDVTYGDIFNAVCLYMIPMVNPDGVSISQFGSKGINSDELREKFLTMEGSGNYSRWKANVNGVNINRNFNSFWVVDKDHPAMEGYCGPYPESEIETRTIADLVNSHNFACSIAFHTAEQTVYYNVGQKGEVFEKAEKLAKLCGKITGYGLGTDESEPRGLDYNWLNLEKGIPALIIECGISWSPLPLKEFPAIWRENRNIPAAVCNLISYDSLFNKAVDSTESAEEAQAEPAAASDGIMKSTGEAGSYAADDSEAPAEAASDIADITGGEPADEAVTEEPLPEETAAEEQAEDTQPLEIPAIDN